MVAIQLGGLKSVSVIKFLPYSDFGDDLIPIAGQFSVVAPPWLDLVRKRRQDDQGGTH